MLNNRGYATDVEIHDGPYNDVKNWDYAALVGVLNGGPRGEAGCGDGVGVRVTTSGELQTAISRSMEHQGVTLIEVHRTLESFMLSI